MKIYCHYRRVIYLCLFLRDSNNPSLVGCVSLLNYEMLANRHPTSPFFSLRKSRGEREKERRREGGKFRDFSSFVFEAARQNLLS